MDRERIDSENMSFKEKPSTAFLIGVYRDKSCRQECERHLEELERLVGTCGIETIGKFPAMLRKYSSSTYLTKGKLEEVQSIIENLDVDFVIFDDEILPSQQRNLEKIFKRTVMDRTEIILEVFAQRAQTKEARIQIELAKTKYQFPRLKRMWTHLERQAGGGAGGVFLKGMGEKQIEVDRRLLDKRLRKLKRELAEVKTHRETQRQERIRSGIPIFAIVGYTNSGKSTLLNALTEAEVLVEDKLFATLDTTTKKYVLPNNQSILLIDTVGFIRKIPHLLVAAFKSTLEEAVQADTLLHLIDVSHPMAEEQAQATYEVLEELGASDKPVITVFNKVDVCQKLTLIDKFRIRYPKTVQISALKREGFDSLLEAMIDEIRKRRQLIKLRVPQGDYEVISELMRLGKVLNQEYEENEILVLAEVPGEILERFKKFVL